MKESIESEGVRINKEQADQMREIAESKERSCIKTLSRIVREYYEKWSRQNKANVSTDKTS